MFGLGNDGIVVLGFWLSFLVYVRLQYRNSLRQSGTDNRSRRVLYDLAELNALVRESEHARILRTGSACGTVGVGGKRTGRKGS